MEQLGSCTAIGCRETGSIGARRSVRDRFQGALLGLWFVPTAVRSARFLADDSANMLAEAVAFSIGQVNAFLQQPHSSSRVQIDIQTKSSPYKNEFLLLASIPGLLRYHDSWERRSQWIRQISAHLSPAADASNWSLADPSPRTQAATIAQILILGDLLELLLGSHSRSPIALLNQLQAHAVPYVLSAPEQHHYEDILAKLLAGVSTGSLNEYQGFVGAALIALHHLESYSVSVQMAAGWGGMAPLVTGVLAGAGGGRASLPVLWQISPRCPEIVAIADDLFSRWAGIAR